MKDILLDYHLPTIGQPNVEEDEVNCALPPHRHQPILNAARRMEDAHLPRGVVPNIGIRPFGLPLGIQREPEHPGGAIWDPLVDCTPSCTNQT